MLHKLLRSGDFKVYMKISSSALLSHENVLLSKIKSLMLNCRCLVFITHIFALQSHL